MKLRTSCSNCKFLNINNTCLANRINYVDKGIYTDGYCDFKRLKGDDSVEEVYKQNETLSLIIDTDKPNDIVNTVRRPNNINQLIIRSNSDDIDWNVIASVGNKNFTYFDFSKTYVQDEFSIERALELSRNDWFIYAKSFSNNIDILIEKYLVDHNNKHPKCFYHLNDVFLTNKYVFLPLEGNYEESIIDKLKQFKNYADETMFL